MHCLQPALSDGLVIGYSVLREHLNFEQQPASLAELSSVAAHNAATGCGAAQAAGLLAVLPEVR